MHDTAADHRVVDVVVITWNDEPCMLDRSIRSVLDSGLDSSLDIIATIVDNGSDPPARPPADDRVRLIRNAANRGVAAARNQGARAGHAPYICLLDSDAELTPGCLTRLVAELDADRTLGLVAPVYAGQRPEASAGRAPSVWRKVARALNLTDVYGRGVTPGEVDFAIGACQVFRREAFTAVGGLDESYFYGPEDVDFCLRLRGQGWRLVQVGDAVCLHPPRRRHKRLLTRSGLRHAHAVARHLWRHRGQSTRPAGRCAPDA